MDEETKKHDFHGNQEREQLGKEGRTVMYTTATGWKAPIISEWDLVI